jgi:hypothetical protein
LYVSVLLFAPKVSFRVRHRAHSVVCCSETCSSSQVTLLEFAGSRCGSRRRFGLQSARLAQSAPSNPSYTTRHAPCTMLHAPRSMLHAPRSMHHATSHGALHRAQCAMHHWHMTLYARHRASCTTHPWHMIHGVVDVLYALYAAHFCHALPPCIIPDSTSTPYLVDVLNNAAPR